MLELLGMVHRSVARRGSLRLLLLGSSLRTYHGLDFFKAHHLPSGCRSLLLRMMRLLVLCLCRLLWFQTPYVCARFQLRDVLGIVIVLVSGPGRL
jgi:hypothetical protein